MSRFSVLIGLLSVSLVVLVLNWPLVQPQLGTLVESVLLPYRIAKLVAEPADDSLLVPVEGVRARDIVDTWGESRAEGRTHEGQDIFAARGTPVRPAAKGYVLWAGENTLGGTAVVVLGAGGRGYYYAHLEGFGPQASVGTLVDETSIIGYVGNTGNASGTPPHLHFGIYTREGASNPYPLLQSVATDED